ncbi:MAG: porin [Pseudomonadota bacterium]
MKSLLLISAGVAALATSPVFADGHGTTVLSGGTGVELTFSGQVNRGVLFVDDGADNSTFFVDNDNSSTRFRFTADGAINENWSAGLNIEIQAESNSTADVTQDNANPDSSNFLSERKLEAYIQGDNFGRLTFGQGDTASNNTSEVDLSGTAVVSYSGVEDFAGGIQFTEDGQLSGTTIGDAFTNLDGLSRRDRIRYDTPSFGGLTLSGSVGAGDAGNEEFYDIAAQYSGDFGAFKLDSAVAYAVNEDDDEIVNGSVSVLSEDTGLSLTLAGGNQEFDAGGDDVTFAYVKAGYQTDALTSLGKTALAVDYAENENVLALDDQATSYGLLAVQKIDAVGTEVYLGVRNYELDVPGETFDDVTAVLAGARIKF